MEFQTFCRIGLKNFSFKFDLRHFLRPVKVKPSTQFGFQESWVGLFEIENVWSGGLHLFSDPEFTQII